MTLWAHSGNRVGARHRLDEHLCGTAARAREFADAQHRARTALEQALRGELAPTWQLMWQAVRLLRELPPGGHIPGRWDAHKDAFTGHAAHLRDGGPPQPRRDSAVVAARRLAWLERPQASYAAQRAFDDPLVMAEYRLTGEAFAGPVTAADPTRQDTTGRRRTLRPHITVATRDPVLAEPGAVLISPARPCQQVQVLSVTRRAGQPAQLLLELSGSMGRSQLPAPGSVPQPGEFVCYATFSDHYQPPPTFPEPEDTPWTHGGPPPLYVPSDDDAQEAWS